MVRLLQWEQVEVPQFEALQEKIGGMIHQDPPSACGPKKTLHLGLEQYTRFSVLNSLAFSVNFLIDESDMRGWTRAIGISSLQHRGGYRVSSRVAASKSSMMHPLS